MILIEETTVPDGALPVEAFKAHLRLGSGFSAASLQDAVLMSFLRAALAAIEGRTGKVLFKRTFRWAVSSWRDPRGQPLPVAPVEVVQDIEIVTRDGARSSVASNAYWLEQDAACPQVRPVGAALPWIPSGGKAEIIMQAGYGESWGTIPADLRQAVLLLAAHYYEFRDETSLAEGCMPFGVSSLLERYKVVRLYAGGAR